MGYLHLYCGEGKGKTTAAAGLALRMAGAGKRAFIELCRSFELDYPLPRFPGHLQENSR